MEKAYLEILEGIVEELARLGAPEDRLRPLRERLLALKVVRMMAKDAPPTPLWGRPLFWTALALLLAVVGALLGLPVHRLFP
ncbi:hypothetical protein KZX47_08880 [Thermus sp. SYSU G05001]|uniref:Uncharacterized protein n=1 Tax=Thermus brevis TaxID=2862456 RepID=A0ABS6ZZ03_9DEIN|nr:hypothetical protein [Thermus brevis]MBW6395260.1 hypothetical protein [Thermus brevis]